MEKAAEMTEQQRLSSVVNELKQEENIESLLYLVNMLPQIKQTFKTVHDIADFIRSAVGDPQSIEEIVTDIEESLSPYRITPENLQAAVSLLNRLPAILEIINQLEPVVLFAGSVLKDKESISYLKESLRETYETLTEGAESMIDIVKETKQRAEQQKGREKISVLGMLKMLKDPSVQKGFIYMKLFLEVINDRR